LRRMWLTLKIAGINFDGNEFVKIIFNWFYKVQIML